MTLIAGFVYDGGVLLCSDSEVGVQGEMTEVKADARKMEHFAGQWGDAVFAGSGNLALAARAVQVCKRLENAPGSIDALQRIDSILANEYEKNVWNNPAYGDDPGLPYSLLLGFRPKGKSPTLHVTYENTLTRVRTYNPQGNGMESCHSVVRQVFRTTMREQEVLALATYALAKAKQDAGGVSGHSTFIILRSNQTTQQFERDLFLSALESHALWFDLRMKQLFTAYANRKVSGKKFENEVVRMNAELLYYRSYIKAEQSIPEESIREMQFPPPSQE